MSDAESERLLYQLLQRFEDENTVTKEWRVRHDNEAAAFKAQMNDRLVPVEEFLKNATFSYKLLLSLAAAIGTVYQVWAWTRQHIQLHN